MNGWFPRLNLAGEVVSGFGEVWFDGEIALDPGYGPQWLDSDRIVAGGAHDWFYRVNVRTGAVDVLTQVIPFGTYGAGGGRWKVAEPIDAETREIGITFDPVIGQCVRLLEHGNRNADHSIFAEGTPIVEHRNVTDVRAFDGMIVWVEFTGADPTDRGVKGIDRTLTVRDLRVTPPGTWQGHPIPVRVRGEAWLVWASNVDIRLHPWHSTQGYVIRTGENRNFNHDAVAVGNAIRIAWQDKDGALTVRDFPLDAPRVDVSFGLQPSPQPDPQPEPKPEPEPMPDPESLLPIVEAVWQKYGGAVESRGAMLNEIAWRGNGGKASGPWGLSRKTSGNFTTQPRTGERIATDIVQYGPTDPETGEARMFDTFKDTGPIWGEAEQHGQPSRIWIAPVAPNGAPTPDPDPTDPELARLKARVAELEREVSDLRRQLAEATSKPRLSYEAMMRLVDRAEAAYVEGEWGRQPKLTIPCATWAHMLWRFMFENYTEAQLVEEARLRGMGQVPD